MSTAPIPAEFLSVNDVAALFGVSSSTVRRWSQSGVIPRPHRIGGATRWTIRELRDWQESLLQHAAGSPGVFA